MGKRLKIFTSVCLLGVIILLGQTSKAETTYPYLIKVNRQQCTVTIYEKDKKGNYSVPIKAMLCSPGWDTPIGSFKTPEKYRWRLLMGDVWGQYSTRINGGILFHSVWYYEQDPATLSNAQFNKLGSVCSHGCVRLNVEDSKWIYDNCPTGTTVTIYDSKDPGPLGKPAPIKVSTANLMGYDPTDIWSSGNPYVKKDAAITGVSNKKVKYGDSVDIKKGVKAYSSIGINITSEMKTTIKYLDKKVKQIDTEKVGKYYVTYSVEDGMGKSAKKEAVFTIVDTAAPVIKGNADKYLNIEDEIDEKEELEILALEKVYALWHNKKLNKDKIRVVITELKNTESLIQFEVKYEVTAPNGKTATKTSYIYTDMEAPVLEGAMDKEITKDTIVDRELALEGIKVTDNVKKVTLDDIKVTITQESDTKYKVSYWVKDESRNIGRQAVYYTVKETEDPSETEASSETETPSETETLKETGNTENPTGVNP